MIYFRRIVFLQAVVCFTNRAGNSFKQANGDSRKFTAPTQEIAQFFVTFGLRQASTSYIPRL